jgi:hypothetical protein
VIYGKTIYGKQMKTKNKVCYLSELGHRNFQYPSNKKAIMKSECKYETLAWVHGSRDLKPVKVNVSCIIPMELDNDPAYDILKDSNENKNIVVWIEK